MKVRVSSFARIREIVGAAALEREAPDGATAGDLWRGLAAEFPSLGELQSSTRLVRDGVLIGEPTALRDGDEIALLPPFGGG